MAYMYTRFVLDSKQVLTVHYLQDGYLIQPIYHREHNHEYPKHYYISVIGNC